MSSVLDFIVSLGFISEVKVGISSPFITQSGKMSPEKMADHIYRNFKKEAKDTKDSEIMSVVLDVDELAKFASENVENFANRINPTPKSKELPSGVDGLFILQVLGDKENKYVGSYTDKTIIHDYSPDVMCLEYGIDKEVAKAMTIFGRPVYLPGGEFLTETYELGRPDKLFLVNSYSPPKWEHKVKSTPRPPEVDIEPFLLLLRQVAVVPEERQYLVSWIKKAIEDRAPTILILCGAPGIGKNTFFSALSAIFGYSNAFTSKESTLEKFNSHLQNSKLLLFDELIWGKEVKEKLKGYANDRVSIESKGENASRGTRNYASMIIMNNEPSNNYVHYDDRKFAPMLTSEERLDVVAEREGIDMGPFILKVNEDRPEYCPHTIKAMYEYIMETGDYSPYPADMSFKGPGFWRLAYHNRAEWQKKLVHVVSHLLLFSDRLRKDSKFQKDSGVLDPKQYKIIFSMYGPNEKLKWSHVSRVVSFGNISVGHDKAIKFLEDFRTMEGEPVFLVEKLPIKNALSEIDFTIELINPEKFILLDDAEAEL